MRFVPDSQRARERRGTLHVVERAGRRSLDRTMLLQALLSKSQLHFRYFRGGGKDAR
jgi:hypothetical protein